MRGNATIARRFGEVWAALGGDTAEALPAVSREDSLPSIFAVSDLATVSIGVAAQAVREWIGVQGHASSAVTVDRRLAGLWFGTSFKPVDWSSPPLWDALAGDYRTADGWIRLHTNAPHHRAAALSVLGAAETREALAARVSGWFATELETAVVKAGGCAAAMRGLEAWRSHPVGAAVSREPLVNIEAVPCLMAPPNRIGSRERPLAGVRVLDLTRILAGPVATRFLAGFGADVLRIDPPGWDEGVTIPDVTLGKRCARLDLATDDGRAVFLSLLAEADVFVHGYRADALERLGLGLEVRRKTAPHAVDVALNAYGWTTDWTTRRGFDSLVQMSCGIADEGMQRFGTDVPKPLPVQALDHATGYLIAAAALRGLTARARAGRAVTARLSLARTAALLTAWGIAPPEPAMRPADERDYAPGIEHTGWGASRRLLPPVTIEGIPMRWDGPATMLGSSEPVWLERAA